MNAKIARWLYFTAQHLRGEPVQSVLEALEASQYWSRERLLAQQWQRQQALVQHAFETVPFYRQRWAPLGLGSGPLTPDAWRRIPPLEKHELRDSGALLVSSRAPRGLKSATSGSSGTPVAVLRSHLSWAHAHANVIRGWHWHGIDVGDRYAYFWGLALDPEGRQQSALRDRFFNRERLSAFEIDSTHAREFYSALRRRPVRWGFGYPSAAANFAHEVSSLGLDGRSLGFKAVVTTSEVLKEHQREILQSTFGCPVVDSYGCAETGVTGFQCEAGSMHVPVESVVVDVEPAADGALEVLLTDLHNYSEPVIRYRVGDFVGPAPEACACGRGLPLLGAIQGRAGDFLTLPDGRVVIGLLPYYIFRPHAKSGTVREYQFVEYPGGRIELRVLPGPGWREGSQAEIEGEVARGFGLPLKLRVVPSIRRIGRGKHRDFVKAEDLGES